MITRMQAKNFKSWRDTGDKLNLAPLTGLFGTNSSGKTGILQTLLLLKQTVESTDRKQILRTGDIKSLVDFGTYADILFEHKTEAPLELSLAWRLPQALTVKDPLEKEKQIFSIQEILFVTRITEKHGRPVVDSFAYDFEGYSFGMRRKNTAAIHKDEYELTYKGYPAKRIQGRAWPLPPPAKCYGFPDEVKAYYQNTGFLPDLVLAFEKLMSQMVYLGPLREYPRRQYMWGGEAPRDVGYRGELAIPALLASKQKGETISQGHKKPRVTLEQRIALWLRHMDLIDSFVLRPIAEHRKDYEVRVRKTAASSEVLITDVGFGVSQILPVLVLCYYVPQGTTILLEQPEIHLHPSVQSALADVLIDAVKTRKVQIIVESHSEHLLRRLQRRIADQTISSEEVRLYFCRVEGSESKLEPLNLDLFGNITNWPENFLGDDMGDVVAMTEEQRKRMKGFRG